MSLLGNLIWIIFGGLISSIIWFITGVLLSITIIGIPFGLQCFKMAGLVLAPFGKNVSIYFTKHPIGNIIWLLVVGWELFLLNAFIGLLFYISIIGIPFGKQWFKLALVSLAPFGAIID